MLGFGRHACGGTCALNVDADDGYLHHGRGSQSLTHQRKAAPRSSAHRPASCMGSANGYVDNSDLVFNLTHHNAQLAPVPRHPVKHTGCGAHRIGTVKTHARRRSSHRQRLVAFEERQFFSGVGQRECERLEMRTSVVVTGAGHSDVFGNDGLPFSFEL